MFKNHLQIAFRTLAKNKTYSIINIAGLAVSLTASILLLLWVWDELSFDKFHSKADRIYNTAVTFDKDRKNVWNSTPAPLATFAKRENPNVEDAVRVAAYNGDQLLEYKDKKFTEENYALVDASFFKIFDFPLIEGNKAKPFNDSRSMVVTQSFAKKYFGADDAIGKVIKVNGKDNYTITGVIKDIPSNSSLRFDYVQPFDILQEGYDGNGFWKSLDADWGNYNYNTYVLVKPNVDATKIGKQFADMHRKSQNGDFNKDMVYLLQPLTQMHLYTVTGEDNGIQVVRIFFIVAIVILLIACINYVNLITARATKRIKEVSVRKVIGAGRSSLFWQFIIESLVVFVIAMAISVLLIYLIMPLYNDISGKTLSFNFFEPRVLVLFGATLVATVLLAGLYPAFTLSSYNPATAIKGMAPGLGRNATFRKALVVVQFTASVVLIISTVVIGQQLNYIRSKNLGFDKQNVFSFNSRKLLDHFDAVKAELLKQPGILGVSAANGIITNLGSATGDIEWDGKTADMGSFMVSQLSADRDFLKVLNLQLAAGQGFTGTPADSTNFLVNETAVKQMHIQDPIGKPLTFHDKKGVIAGVIKDFHFKNMRSNIEPLVLWYNPNWSFWRMYVKTTGKDARKAIAAVEKTYKQYNPDYAFDYKFLDEDFNEMYKNDTRVGELFNGFALIAIIISCLGLFGLVTYTAETKVKEIGIRKTLGASAGNIIVLLSKDFMKLVLVSLVISFPIAWYMMSRWLTNYAYRTDIKWWIFALAGICAFAIALLTVSSKAFRAAQSNPVKSLRSE